MNKDTIGIQKKELRDGYWIKYDKFGYEGLSEVLSYRFARLLKTRLSFLRYEPFKENGVVGCISKDIASSKLISLIDLFPEEDKEITEESIIEYYIPKTIQITGLRSFGEWLTELFIFDMIIVNEDRNPGNILFIYNDQGFDYAPIMDNANSLGYRQNKYPIAKPLLVSHEKQSDIFKKIFVTNMDLIETHIKVFDLFDYYDSACVLRACEILDENVRKYFNKKLIYY